MTYKEIGKHLAISERTVRFHMSEAIQRLHLQNRNQVLSLAEKLGLNTLNSPET
jgi:DNA-binding CsgD family transcriptional regulator